MVTYLISYTSNKGELVTKETILADAIGCIIKKIEDSTTEVNIKIKQD